MLKPDNKYDGFEYIKRDTNGNLWFKPKPIKLMTEGERQYLLWLLRQ